MVVASPRLSFFLFLFFFSLSTSLPVFLLPCIHPSFSSYTSSFFLIPNSTHTHFYIYMYIHIHTHTYEVCILCFRSHSMYHPSILPPPFRLVLFLLPFCSFLSRARGLPYVCPDLKIVWLVPGRGVPNELEIRSQPRTRER